MASPALVFPNSDEVKQNSARVMPNCVQSKPMMPVLKPIQAKAMPTWTETVRNLVRFRSKLMPKSAPSIVAELGRIKPPSGRTQTEDRSIKSEFGRDQPTHH